MSCTSLRLASAERTRDASVSASLPSVDIPVIATAVVTGAASAELEARHKTIASRARNGATVPHLSRLGVRALRASSPSRGRSLSVVSSAAYLALHGRPRIVALDDDP